MAKPKTQIATANEADNALAHELAQALRWKLAGGRQGDVLASHLRKLAAKPDFDAEKYAKFLAKTWMKPAALSYYNGDKEEVARFFNSATALEAGRIFVDSFLHGDFDEKKSEATASGEKRITTTYETWDEDALEAGDTDDRGYKDEEGVLFEDEEGETAVEQAITFLSHSGATQFSSSTFDPRGWYSTDGNDFNSRDLQTGDITIESFHLNEGWSDEEKEAIYNGVIKGIRPTSTLDEGAIASLRALASSLATAGVKHSVAIPGVAVANEGGFPHILPPSDHEAEQYLDEHLIHWHNGMDAVYALSSNWCVKHKHEVPREVAEEAISLLERYTNDPRHAEDKEELETIIGYIREAIDEADAFGRGDRDSGLYYNFYNQDGSDRDDEANASASPLQALASVLAAEGIAHTVVAAHEVLAFGTSSLNDKALLAIEQGKPVKNSNGSVRGLPKFDGKGWARDNTAANAEVDEAIAADPEYWLYSYNTPIGVKINGQWYKFAARYSPTTTRHQSILWQLNAKPWSEFNAADVSNSETGGMGLF